MGSWIPDPSGDDRVRLLEAMLRQVAASGYDATTADGVAAAANVSPQRFAELFADKEACFLAAYDGAVDVLLAHVAQTYRATAGAPWADRIVAALRSLLEMLASEAEIVRIAVVEVGALGEQARVRYREAMLRFAPFLDEGRAASAQGDGLPAETARFAIGAASSIIFDEVRAGRGPELPRILPDLSFAMLMPYLGAETAEAETARLVA